jgi:hypothetical protein
VPERVTTPFGATSTAEEVAAGVDLTSRRRQRSHVLMPRMLEVRSGRRSGQASTGGSVPAQTDMWQVDAVNGRVHDGINTPLSTG